ncbi:MAG: DUF4013 domain-containing protein [Methanocella sp.]
MDVVSPFRRLIEGATDTIDVSIDYAVARRPRLLYGGLLFLASLTVIGLPLLIGYLDRCVRESLTGRDALPSIDRPADDYIAGLKVGFLWLFYFVVTVIAVTYFFFEIVRPAGLTFGERIQYDVWVSVEFGNVMLTALLTLFVLFSTNAWLRYIVKGDYLASLNPLSVIEWMLRYPTMTLKNFYYCTTIAFLVFLACIPIVTIPWVTFIGLATSARVHATLYARESKAGDPFVLLISRILTVRVLPDHPLFVSALADEWQQRKEYYRLWPTGIKLPGWLVEWPVYYVLNRLYHTLRSLKYAFTNGHSMFWGGVVVLLSPILIATPLLFGYLSRCLRETLRGSRTLPHFENKTQLYLEGLKVSVLSLEYLALTYALFWLSSPLFDTPVFHGATVNIFGWIVITNLNVLLPAALHAFFFSMFFNNAWLRYVITGKMLPSMNPVSMAGWMLTYPEIIFNNMMSTGILGLLLAVPGFLIFTIPFITFVGFAANAFIRGESFEKLMVTGGIRKSPVVKDLVKIVTPRAIRK